MECTSKTEGIKSEEYREPLPAVKDLCVGFDLWPRSAYRYRQ